MTRQEFLRELESLMEIAPDCLTGDTVLKEVSQWDSMMILSFILLVQEKLNRVVDGTAIGKARTVNDLVSLLSDQIQD